ncbi:MAG: hypothetical protein KKB59_20035, partial [Spirochaetes bacterium]|nr:hypothetical protein [Spirochaetota bacterium]
MPTPTPDLSALSEAQQATVRQKMYRAFLPTYAHEVLRGPPEYGGKFMLGPHHLEWGRAINENDRIL